MTPRQKYWSITVLIVLIIAGVFWTRGNLRKDTARDEPATPRYVVDALGRKVALPNIVKRIVALGNTPRMVVYLGLTENVVGVGSLPPDKISPLTAYAYAVKDAWKDIPVVGTDAMGNTNYYSEEIVSVEPDVILCTYPEATARDLEKKTGVPVFAVSAGTLFDKDYEESLRLIGEVCGVEDRANEVVKYLNDSLEDLRHRTEGVSEDERPSVLSAAATFKGVHGIESVRLQDPVLDAVNVKNIAARQSGTPAAIVDREQILVWNPDYIFCDFGGVPLVREDQKKRPDFYERLDAFSHGRVYQHPSSTSYFNNLEISLANCYFIGSILYPQRFTDVDAREKAEEIFEFFLGRSDLMSALEEMGAFYGPIRLDEAR